MLSVPFVITVLSEKGGVWKTTLALHLAWMLARRRVGTEKALFQSENKLDVLLVDADPQASVMAWRDERKEDTPFTLLEYAEKDIHEELERRIKGDGERGWGQWFDVCVIDCPPRVTDIARSAVFAADSVVIPVQPSSLDVWASQNTIALIESLAPYKKPPEYCIALNRVIVNTEISRKVDTALRKAGMPVLDTWIKQRVAYAECVSAGKTIFETEPSSKAALEMRQLFKDLWFFIQEGVLE